jgi:ABC-type nitrate/sulfonate/bicarbonate transport system substrate-binding protein
MFRKSRLLLFIAVAGALAMLMTACTPPVPQPVEQEQNPVSEAEDARRTGTLRIAYGNDLDMRELPIVMALNELEALGYTVEKISLSATSLVIEALVRGDADLGIASTRQAWSAIAKGGEFRTITQRCGSTLVVAGQPELTTCQDLDGGALAISAPTTIAPVLINKWVQENCPDAEFELLAIRDQNGRAAALITGSAEAALLDTQYLLQAESEASKRFSILIPLAEEYPQVHYGGVHARIAWLQENPQLVQDFLKAQLAATRRIIADPDVLYEEAVKEWDLEVAVAQEVGDIYLQASMWDPNGGLTLESIQETVDLLVENESIEPGLKAEDIADLSYLEAALNDIGRQ